MTEFTTNSTFVQTPAGDNLSLRTPTAIAFKNEDLYADQYILVREIEALFEEHTTAQRQHKQLNNGIVDGTQTYLNVVNNQSVNNKDPEVFTRHCDIREPFRMKIDFLRDFKNCLKLLSDEDHFNLTEQLESDTNRQQIAKVPVNRFHENPTCTEELVRDTVKQRDYRMVQEVGSLPKLSLNAALDEFNFQVYLEIEMVQNGRVVEPKLYTGVKYTYELDEFIEFPMRVCDLSPHTSLAISIYNMDTLDEVPLASTVIDIFDYRRCMRQGTFNLQLHMDKDADTSLSCKTPGLTDEPICAEINNTLKLMEYWRRKQEVKFDWQDRHSFQALCDKLFSLYMDQSYKDQKAFLEVRLPEFGRTVLYMDQMNNPMRRKYSYPSYMVANYSNFATNAQQLKNTEIGAGALDSLDHSQMGSVFSPENTNDLNTKPNNSDSLQAYEGLFQAIRTTEAIKQRKERTVEYQKLQEDSINFEAQSSLQVCKFHDPLIMLNDPSFLDRQSPIVDKFFLLTREEDNVSATQLRPNKQEKQILDQSTQNPIFQLMSQEEKSLIWRFRYAISSEKVFLPKFLLAIEWTRPNEREQAIQLMNQWAEIDLEQALALLSGLFCLNDVYTTIRVVEQNMSEDILKKFKEIRHFAVEALKTTQIGRLELVMGQLVQALRYEELNQTPARIQSGLKEFLFSKAITNEILAHKMHWFIKVESQNAENGEEIQSYYARILEELFGEIEDENPSTLDAMESAVQFRKTLLDLSTYIKKLPEKVDKMKQQLRLELQGNNPAFNMMNLGEHGMVVPHEPLVRVYSVIPDKCSVFKSAVKPMKFSFMARKFPSGWNQSMPMPELEEYSTLVKNGDDLRQDQLMVTMFTLMDRLLREVNIDLKFTNMNVLACTKDDGIMEFVPSETVQEIQNNNKQNLNLYLDNLSDAPSQKKEIMNNFLLSNAGYAVATYLMAIGDRHLENLMVRDNGQFFHLDFGFILGKNPPLKGYKIAPIRINRAMVKGFGGKQSEGYQIFKSKTIDAFLYLRNFRHMMMHILTLMIDATIGDLPKDNFRQILTKMNDRFWPHLSNEEARARFTEILDQSVDSTMDGFIQLTHEWAVMLKY